MKDHSSWILRPAAGAGKPADNSVGEWWSPSDRAEAKTWRVLHIFAHGSMASSGRAADYSVSSTDVDLGLSSNAKLHHLLAEGAFQGAMIWRFTRQQIT